MRAAAKLMSGILAAIFLFGLPLGIPANAATQKASFSAAGTCVLNFQELGEYALYEQVYDDCYLRAKVTPAKTVRIVELQWWSEAQKKWTTENWVRTDKSGSASFFISPYCMVMGQWCEGKYIARLVVLKSGKLPAIASKKFEFVFYPSQEQSE